MGYNLVVVGYLQYTTLDFDLIGGGVILKAVVVLPQIKSNTCQGVNNH